MSELHYGDALLVLPTLAAESVQCCVTSPPYWGLRDYGTAKWEGGDPACVHGVQRWDGPKQTQGAMSGHASKANRLARRECVCGAKRTDVQIGMEGTPTEYVARLVEVFREVRRMLRDDGVLWLNLGDSYSNIGKWGGRTSGKHARGLHGGHQTSSQAHGGKIEGLKPKDLLLMPARVALALQADGWYVRSDVIWAKPNPMPESVKDRPTRSHEHIYLLSKSADYYYDADAIAEPFVGKNDHDRTGGIYAAPGQPEHNGRADGSRGTYRAVGRNRRDVWTITPKPYKGAHFAVFPPELPRFCILAGSRIGDVVLDPFSGSGTTGAVAERLGRKFVGIDLNEEYRELAERRIAEGA